MCIKICIENYEYIIINVYEYVQKNRYFTSNPIETDT
jgi:hypothetical protein